MSLPGEHNVLNVLAVFCFFHHVGADMSKVIDNLVYFKSTKRRFQVKEETGGVTFVDDYAHHPTEIKATLKAARMRNPARLVVVFQPHRFSRAQILFDEFAGSFFDCDCLVMTDLYAASEEKPRSFDEEAFRTRVKTNFRGEYKYISKTALREDVPSFLKEGDLVLFLGAGDINIISDEIIREFRRRRDKI